MSIKIFYINEFNNSSRYILYVKSKFILKVILCILIALFILSFPNKVISSDLNAPIVSNNIFPKNTDIFEPKLRPTNLSSRNLDLNLIINSKNDLILPPLKPRNFDEIVSQAHKSHKNYDTISFNRFDKTNKKNGILKLKTDIQKFNFINKFDFNHYALIATFGPKTYRTALFRKANGSYQSIRVNQEIDGWKILEINLKNIKIQKGLQSEVIKISDKSLQ